MTENKREDLPDMPEEVKIAIETKKLIVFLGSGVSIACGLPSWEQLAYGAIKEKVPCGQF